ncbi:DUF234 domain-containing protein [Adlercreutzia sp. ZJ141]|uniref:DUF234 domain-containing protein n=1 Tax=Adlercreutzia sp. ZJ141 TaxID=2709406 RepID=UPI0013EA1202|nr:DUF234 domain-containing protein [Adlercreutzia sp. ZJ141]
MIDSQKANVYLKNLMELGLMMREFPVGSSLKEQSKGARGLYRIADEFFRFWYAFVFPNKSDLDMMDVDGVYQFDIEPRLAQFSSLNFEDICRAWLRERNCQRKLSCRFGEIGRFWNKQLEIDALGLSKASGDRPIGASALVGECKFGKSLVGTDVLDDLDEKACTIGLQNVDYYLFSRAGFTPSLKAHATQKATLHLVSIEELYED